MDNSINTNHINIANTNTSNNVKQVAKDFEQLFLTQLLKTSLSNVNIAGTSAGSDIVKDMYLENIAKSTAGTMGISQMLVEHLSTKNKSEK
jgi:Rod binding domain-containing protein